MTLCLTCEDEIELDESGVWLHLVPEPSHAAVPQCPHTLGPVGSCTICNGREKAREAERNKIVAETQAHLTGNLSCGHESVPGTRIFLRVSGGWVCKECAG